MSAREKPAPLVWIVRNGLQEIQTATLGRWTAIVWCVGGEYSHRSRLMRDGVTEGRIVSHFGLNGALTSAEKRLRKAAT